MKQEKNSKDAERDAVITKYEQFENNAREREARKDLYDKTVKFINTRVELDFASFKDDIWSH